MVIKNILHENHFKYYYIPFFIGYTIYYLSCFLADVVQTEYTFDLIIKLLRYGSYVFFAISAILSNKKKREFIIFFFMLTAGIVIFVNNDVLNFCILFLMAFGITKINERHLLKYSFILLSLLTIIVLLLCACGILENVNTPRYPGDVVPRYGLGFYHSNVLPLILLYSSTYWILLKKDGIKYWQYVVLGLLHIFVYMLCQSRNVILLSTILILGGCALKKIKFSVNFMKVLNFVSSIIVLMYTVVSVFMTVYLDRSAILQKLDKMFSYRFTYSMEKAQNLGLHLITYFDTDAFFADGVVVDSGYCFIVIRYGLLFAFVLAVLCYCYIKRIGNQKYILLVMFVIATINFVDNDIFDYLCLPYILFIIKNNITGNLGIESN